MPTRKGHATSEETATATAPEPQGSDEATEQPQRQVSSPFGAGHSNSPAR